MPGFRKLKNQVREWLQAPDWEQRLESLEDCTPAELVGPLFSMLLHSGELKWHAVTALGLTIDRMAGQRMEDARVVMRRLIWNLSEESGNLGWGAPEAMGEIAANNRKLAEEYNRCLISYILQTGRDDNFMDHLPLRRGAYWGVARFAQAHPDLALPALESCLKGLEHPAHAPEDLHEKPDPEIHGLCAWALGSMAAADDERLQRAVPRLERLLTEQETFPLYRHRILKDVAVASLAREALERLQSRG